MKNLKIFVVDDEEIIRISLADDLRDAGYKVEEFSNAASALSALQKSSADIIFTDIKMPGMDGLELLKKVKTLDREIIVIVMTAFGSINTAVEAMRNGAYDYITKPFQADELTLLLQRVEELLSIKKNYSTFTLQLQEKFDFSSVVGTSKAVQEMFSLLKTVSPSEATVLITGETGTGKELIANIIHYNSPRKEKPLIRVSCAILSREIFESELFGHEKGAFTGADKIKKGRFEIADEGSIYLDDVDDIPLEMQVKLLRVLQEKEFERVGGTETIKTDVRVIASTKADLRQLVKEGKFREDLFYRLNVFPVHLKPLREREEDVIQLANYFIKYHSQNKPLKVHEEVYEILKKYHWPGNVRELKNLIERLVLLSSDGEISIDKIPAEFYSKPDLILETSIGNKTIEELLTEYEIKILNAALHKTAGNKTKAAEILGVPPSTLRSKIDKYGLT
jgi:DNA-binding NtrC family response regulator